MTEPRSSDINVGCGDFLKIGCCLFIHWESFGCLDWHLCRSTWWSGTISHQKYRHASETVKTYSISMVHYCSDLQRLTNFWTLHLGIELDLRLRSGKPSIRWFIEYVAEGTHHMPKRAILYNLVCLQTFQGHCRHHYFHLHIRFVHPTLPSAYWNALPFQMLMISFQN